MRTLIVGAGALGGMIGACLTRSGEDVTLIDNNAARVRLIQDSGLYIAEGTEPESCVRVNIVPSTDGVEPVDLVFVSVKCYQTEGAIRSVAPLMGPETLVLSMQNGIGSADVIADIVGPPRVLTGITYHSVQHAGPNRLRFRKGIKPIQIAPYDGEIRPDIARVGEVFSRAGLDTDVCESIEVTIWQKLLHNAVINPVSALTGLTCQELLGDEELQQFMRDLCAEIIAVMQARGIPIHDEEDPYRPLLGSQRALGKNRPSMWQDLTRGMRTEIDAINGAVVREAKKLGVPVPHNKAIVHFVRSRERQKFLSATERVEAHRSAIEKQPTRRIIRSTGVDPEGGMPEGRVPLKCAARLREMVGEYYRDLEAADRDPQRRVAWVAGTGPVELLRAFGFAVYFPENHAALIGATRQSGTYITRALAEGFSPFASTGMASDVGAMLAGESPLMTAHGVAGPPRPDVCVYTTNFGQDLVRWFEWSGDRFDVPVFGLHPPGGLERMGLNEVSAAVGQTLDLARQLRDVAGCDLDYDRLGEVVQLSAEACDLWRQILDLARAEPSPLTFFDVLIHMAPVVMMRGTPQAVEYYRILRDELEERVTTGLAAVPGERFRFFWEGPPIWCALRPLARLFLEHRVAIVGSTYGSMFAFEGFDATNPVESTTRAYTGIFTNRSDRTKANVLQGWFRHYGVDGVVYHDARTSPELSNVRYGLARRLQKQTGLPAVVIEADAHDPRLFAMDPVERQLARLVEQANDASQQRSSASDRMTSSPTTGQEVNK